MLGRSVRKVALCALATVVLAPVAVAGAAPGIPVTPTTRSAPSTSVPSEAPGLPVDPQATWDSAYAQAGGTPTARGAVEAAAAATVSVSPSTDLVSGQSVTVTGTGLGTESVAVLQCVAGLTQAYGCDLGFLRFLLPDASGNLTSELTVLRTIDASGDRVNCATAPGTCEIVIASGSGAEILARQGIAFDPNAPLPNPAIVGSPTSGLLAGQSISVSGSGFAANDSLYLRQCAVGNPDCFGSGGFTRTDGDGNFVTDFVVSLRIADLNGTATHCLAVDCILRVESARDREYRVDVPLSFDPSQPLPPTPVITVTPSTGLLHDQTVDVVGSGFDPNAFVQLSECGPSANFYCYDYLQGVQSDESGAFATSVSVSRLATEFGPTGITSVDCAFVACSVSAESYVYEDSFRIAAEAPITFDASVPPPPIPTLEVTPNADLPYRAELALHGTGFSPGEFVYAQFCVNSSTSGGCGYRSAEGQADSNGDVDMTLGVKRRISSDGDGSSVIDCVDPGTECSVSVQGNRQYERAQVVVTFDPNAPIPPSPVGTVTPDQDLGWKQVVNFSGSGFTPGLLQVQQCGRVMDGDYSYLSCVYPGTVATADADGNLVGTIEVRRMLASDFGPGGPTLDCATSATPCTLRFGYGDPDETASVDLGFDPNSQPPPPPVLHLIPASHLHDGEDIGVWGSGYTPGSVIGLAPCASGATSIADTCDLGRAFTAQANEAGDFLATYNVQGVIGTSRGATDCTEAPEACILAGVNVNDLSEFASAPFSVDPIELELHSTSVVEGTGGVTVGHVRVELSAPIGHPTMVEWRAHPGTASEDDYLSRSGRIMIPAGETEGMIHVRVMGDATNEPTERFTVEAIEAMGTTITDATATVKILDDDAEPVVTTADMTFVEGDDGTKIGVVPVWLSAPTGRDVLVSYRSHHGSARSDSDFVRERGEVVIKAGDTGAFIFFDIVNDRVREGTESFTMELRKADHAQLQDDLATVTILDND